MTTIAASTSATPATSETKDPDMTDSAANSASTPPASMKDANALVEMAIGRSKEDGRLTLEINAKALHDLLDSMGARHGTDSYTDKPATSVVTIARDGKMSTELLLRCQYPVKVALAPCFERPPTKAQLKAVCESAHDAVKTILAHYQPIDIKYSIHKVIK
jgi:hypothetical protein